MGAHDAQPGALSWDQLVERALRAGASDLHMHIDANHAVVRARLDGAMVPWGELTTDVVMPALTRMKASADLGTSRSLLVGEGRVTHQSANGPVDLRLTVTPLVAKAIKVAVRLPVLAVGIPLGELGFSPANLELFTSLLESPDGLVLATGPTGAGKTTTLLSALDVVGGPTRVVVTVEDPVERLVVGADQIEVNADAGFTFEHILRSLLRMDLDVLLIGEIRDTATARHAIQIAKAGRLVLSSLHSGSAVGALARLHELSGLGDLEVIESVRGVVSQRLVRKTCTACAAAGCSNCLWTGFAGRVPLHEVLIVTDALREAVLRHATATELNQVAQQGGMRTFKQDADRWTAGGKTTLHEIERVLGRG
jgi:type II secretory ATPase GspE/PulE/Tfp pilus assembly ATPase PilB-like protein